MSQSPSRSLLARSANIIAFFGLTVALRLLLFPAYGLQQTFGPSLRLGLSLTAEALRRSIVIRRVFAGPTT